MDNILQEFFIDDIIHDIIFPYLFPTEQYNKVMVEFKSLLPDCYECEKPLSLPFYRDNDEEYLCEKCLIHGQTHDQPDIDKNIYLEYEVLYTVNYLAIKILYDYTIWKCRYDEREYNLCLGQTQRED